MLNLLDSLLRYILMREVTGLREPAQPSTTPPFAPLLPISQVKPQQIGFQPPDAAWRSQVETNLKLNALNVYLVDLRENPSLRSNERLRSIQDGMVYEEPSPQWLDCHYLISAWNPSKQITPMVEPVFDEHALLYETAAVLMNNAPLNPSRMYTLGSSQLQAWEPYDRSDIPTKIAPADGFPKLSEFWSSMGSDMRWRPALYMIVTVPVSLLRTSTGPAVTTITTAYEVLGRISSGETMILIGGYVTALVNNRVMPIDNATVALETTTGDMLQWTQTNVLGQYTFNHMQPGQYQLRALAAGLGETPRRNVDVPSPTGEYDLQFP